MARAKALRPFSPNFHRRIRGEDVVDPPEGAVEGQGDENLDAVGSRVILSANQQFEIALTADPSGLDNAGKTTIVKKVMNEDVNTVSPTLGFIIKTIDYEG